MTVQKLLKKKKKENPFRILKKIVLAVKTDVFFLEVPEVHLHWYLLRGLLQCSRSISELIGSVLTALYCKPRFYHLSLSLRVIIFIPVLPVSSLSLIDRSLEASPPADVCKSRLIDYSLFLKTTYVAFQSFTSLNASRSTGSSSTPDERGIDQMKKTFEIFSTTDKLTERWCSLVGGTNTPP